jgi:hypothetical protein
VHIFTAGYCYNIKSISKSIQHKYKQKSDQIPFQNYYYSLTEQTVHVISPKNEIKSYPKKKIMPIIKNITRNSSLPIAIGRDGFTLAHTCYNLGSSLQLLFSDLRVCLPESNCLYIFYKLTGH